MSTGAQYVVAAYAVVLFALLIYVVVLGLKSARTAREAELLALLVERAERVDEARQPPHDDDGSSPSASGPPATGRGPGAVAPEGPARGSERS